VRARISTRRHETWHIIEVTGELDLAAAPELRQATRDATYIGPSPRVLVDLSRCELLDSVSLGILLGASRRINDRSGCLRLVVDGGLVHRTFELTGTADLFTLVRTVEEAFDI